MLPTNERRVVDRTTRCKIWVYGPAFSGKSTLADQFPNPIFLNTDGNINSFTAPVVEVKDLYDKGMRIKMGWDVFTEAITDLARGGHNYETVVVDLVEDTYELCRLWSYKKMGIEHESDNSFKAWDFVRNHFLNVFKQLTTLPMNVVLLSHEDTSRDLTRRTGERVTSVSPAIQDKVANKLAGMVDVVARLTVEPTGRFLNFKSDDMMFGGGRLTITSNAIPDSYEAIRELYAAQAGAPAAQAPVATAHVGSASSLPASTVGSTAHQSERVVAEKKPQGETPCAVPASPAVPPQAVPATTTHAVKKGTPKAPVQASSVSSDEIPF